MQLLASYLSGSWSPGIGSRDAARQPGHRGGRSPRSPRGGHDLAAAFALRPRRSGSRELGALTFAQRGALLAALAKAIHGAREELIALAVANGGNTRGDAKFDIDGGAVTLSHYAELGAKLGARALLADGEPIQVGRTARMGGQHVWARRRGVAVHINAFNFPGWGLCEKLACALLAGHAGDREAGDRDRAGRAPDGRAVRAAAARGRAAAARRPGRHAARSRSARATSSRSPAAARPRACCARTPSSSTHGGAAQHRGRQPQRRGPRPRRRARRARPARCSSPTSCAT